MRKTSSPIPGPYEANNMGIIYSTTSMDAGGGATIIADCDNDQLEAEEIMANAKLLAASWELKEALDDAVWMLREALVSVTDENKRKRIETTITGALDLIDYAMGVE